MHRSTTESIGQMGRGQGVHDLLIAFLQAGPPALWTASKQCLKYMLSGNIPESVDQFHTVFMPSGIIVRSISESLDAKQMTPSPRIALESSKE
eukprot:1624269-Ditylum_brightwellii.AAC.1